jgi:hypothetical protein
MKIMKYSKVLLLMMMMILPGFTIPLLGKGALSNFNLLVYLFLW